MPAIFAATIVITGLLWGSARAAAAGDTSPRVGLLDTVAFTSTLERINTRQKVEEGVASAIRAHGWEPVTVSTECRDLTCAGAVAAQTGTSYVLILVGRFVSSDTYATDVGVVLWHDGTVVGSRTETQEDAERGVGAGAAPRCGPPDGTCTPQLLQSKLEQYAGRVLDAEKASLRARMVAAPAPSQISAAAPSVVPSPHMPQATDGPHAGRFIGWSLVAAGALSAGGAVGLWAASGAKTHCSPAATGDGDGCRYQWNTTTPAIVLGVAGAAAAAAGVVLLISDRPASRLALALHASGVGFEGSF